MTDLIAFSKDLGLWRNIGDSFTDIFAVANDSDVLEWHVTISKFSNNNKYKFHFIILWHFGFPKIQPKISLLFGQRSMVESPRFFGNWVLLNDHLSVYSITAVLLNLRKIVKRINTDLVDVNKFNSQNCVQCNYAQNQSSKTNNNKLIIENNNNNNMIKNDSINNLSASNLSIGSLTISNCTDHSLESENTGITQLSIDKQIENTKIIAPVKNKNKIKKKPKTQKIAVRYLEANENGELVFKWSEGRRPNEI